LDISVESFLIDQQAHGYSPKLVESQRESAYNEHEMQNTFLKDEADAKFHILAEVTRQITSILAIDELLFRVVRLIRETFDSYHEGIGLIESDEVVYRAGVPSVMAPNPFR
jgi:hypothetical protein